METPHATTVPGLCLYEAGMTDIGCCRATNEDAESCFESLRTPGAFAMIVADGVAGNAAGDVASRLAVQAVGEYFMAADVHELCQVVESAMHAANLAVLEGAAADPMRAGMATACTVALVRAPELAIGHIGDCRAYLVRSQEIMRLTHDHSIAGDYSRRGETIPPERRSMGSVLTRWLGKSAAIEVDVVGGVSLRDQDKLVLCSDGLFKVVEDAEILAAVSMHLPGAACRRLVELARERGGPDNIAVRVARLERNFI